MHLAVVDPLPLYRQGVSAALADLGYTVDAPEDPLTWVRRTPGLLLLTLLTENDWLLLNQLRTAAVNHHLIAVLTSDSVSLGARAIRAGAQSVLDRAVTDEVMRRTVVATLDGQAVMPAAVATALTAGTVAAPRSDPALSAEQLAWLRQLAAGMTVARLAHAAGYSERAMYRLLQALYRQLGVRTRIQALMLTQEQGWLRADVSP
ncbi:helix-turn-helix domain-containing protein [Actinoplanes awajinensis]|nr:DNA-binding response regulator [Actinoplanes awajinensis]